MRNALCVANVGLIIVWKGLRLGVVKYKRLRLLSSAASLSAFFLASSTIHLILLAPFETGEISLSMNFNERILVRLADGQSGNEETLGEAELNCHPDIAGHPCCIWLFGRTSASKRIFGRSI